MNHIRTPASSPSPSRVRVPSRVASMICGWRRISVSWSNKRSWVSRISSLPVRRGPLSFNAESLQSHAFQLSSYIINATSSDSKLLLKSEVLACQVGVIPTTPLGTRGQGKWGEDRPEGNWKGYAETLKEGLHVPQLGETSAAEDFKWLYLAVGVRCQLRVGPTSDRGSVAFLPYQPGGGPTSSVQSPSQLECVPSQLLQPQYGKHRQHTSLEEWSARLPGS
ncbi:hypothetical protein LIER_32040 [Lithospermum erythrorhizon]|uniref:Uncharacterized protein n=1 Tax=Lithospermum erythrorhizon TaxID=34254 RepID=A0AAV3RWL2_LITER